jgi:hypothetical protein
LTSELAKRFLLTERTVSGILQRVASLIGTQDMATNEENDNFIPPFDAGERDAFPTREQLNDKSRPDPLDFDEPDSSHFDVITSSDKKSGAPDSKQPAEPVDESDSALLQSLTVKARGLGMNEDEIEQIKDTGALRSVISALQRQATTETNVDLDSRRKSEEGEGLFSEYDAVDAIDADDALDPSAIKAIKALKVELDKLRSKSVDSATSTARPEDADYLIAKLGDDYVDLFGDGPASSLSPRSEEYKARATVVEEMQRIRDGAKASKKRIPDSRETFDQAIRSVFGSQVQKAERRRLSNQVKQRESQLIARPTNNGKRVVSGRDRAIESVTQLMRDRMSNVPDSLT